MKRFGPSWGAPACDDILLTETPVNERCIRCDGIIAESDSGLLLPFLGKPGDPPELAYHLDCFLASIGVAPDIRRLAREEAEKVLEAHLDKVADDEMHKAMDDDWRTD